MIPRMRRRSKLSIKMWDASWNTSAELNLTDRTYVVFTSDNGGTQQYTAPLNGSRGQLYEGGIRVPAVVTGPGIKKPGGKFDAPISSIDWYPTFLELAKLKAPANQVLDGVSIVPAMEGSSSLSRQRLFWHFPSYVGKATPSRRLRRRFQADRVLRRWRPRGTVQPTHRSQRRARSGEDDARKGGRPFSYAASLASRHRPAIPNEANPSSTRRPNALAEGKRLLAAVAAGARSVSKNRELSHPRKKKALRQQTRARWAWRRWSGAVGRAPGQSGTQAEIAPRLLSKDQWVAGG